MIVKEECAAAAVEPKNAEEKSEVANACGDERFFCGGHCTRFMNPESDEQIRRESDEFPANEKQKQTVGNHYAEHGGGEKREIREKPSGILFAGPVADAEDKNAEPNP